jgi:Glycosyl hydrolases family 28
VPSSKSLKRSSLLFLLIVASAALAHAKDVSVKDFGVAADGKTLDTAAIQKAIDEVASAGGGKVTVPKGTYLCGTLVLKDNLTLHLEDGAEILGTEDLTQYKNLDPFKDGLGAEVGTAFVTIIDAKNVTIEGKGTFNGNGAAVAKTKSFKGEGWGFRPMLFRVVRGKNITVRDVTFRDSASWTTNYFQCDGVKIANVKIDSHVAPHNDGINIDASQNFSIDNCDVHSGDDALVLKSTTDIPCRNITATNLKLRSNQGAIKLGTESLGGFENIRVSKCEIRDTRNGGIKILCVDGGTLQNVVVEDIVMDNVRTPIFVRLGARLKTFREGDQKKPASAMKNVVIRNVKANAAADAQIMPPSGIFITGIPGGAIEDLRLENIDIALAGGGASDDARAVVEEKIDVYPEINRFGKTLPAFGVFLRHARGVKLDNFTFTLDAADHRPALVAEDVTRLEISGWKIPATAPGATLIRLAYVQDATLSRFALQGSGAATLVRIEGKASAKIDASNTAPTGADIKTVEFGAGANSTSVTP